ncbi:RNA polymerase II transcription factor B 52 kDa subunit [Dinochytrium kinnereticum]|nr:RNA polymerase II transcription factor B 52 kDa subunit [Dinochytrium kinnereticum]
MSILQYIESLPKNTFSRLYEQPATCLAILRLLPPLAKHVVFRMLYVKSPILPGEIESWSPPGAQGKLHDALRRLAKFNICSDDGRGFLLNSVFQKNLHNALVGGGQAASFGQPSDSNDKHTVDVSYLDKYASEAWEAVLHFLVGTPSDKKPKAVMKLMEHSARELGIRAGLLSAAVVNYDILAKDYSVDALTDTQKQMLDDLKHLGIVYQRKKKSSRFYPTRLATSLTSKYSTASTASDGNVGFVIVETNFKVYAYTNSPIQIAILSLFVSLKSRFANMVVGQITRDSVREALANGITADQNPTLPGTVVDQIRLWEMERNRVRISTGFLYQDFKDTKDYKDLSNYGKDLGYVLWSSDERKMFVVSSEGHVGVREYYTKRKNQ